MNKIEVYKLDELPIPEENMKYFACIGGSKNYECFYESTSLSRAEFMEKYADKLDKCHIPIYEDDDIKITQDAQIPIPGFYIIATKGIYKKLCYMDIELYKKCLNYVAKVRKLLKEEFNIENAYMYYDEHYKKPSSTHLWVMPVYEDVVNKYNLDATILSKDIWTYQDIFEFQYTKDDIYRINDRMRELLNK